MRPLFDKNDVQIDFPYQIEHEAREKLTLACPRCGHVQQRTKNVVCSSCNHMMPTDKCRQSWNNLPKNEYKEMAKVLFADPNKPNKEFRKARGSYGWQQKIRSILLTFVIAALVVVPAIFGLKAYMGAAAWSKVEQDVEQMIHKIGNTNIQPAATATAGAVEETTPPTPAKTPKHNSKAKKHHH